MFFYLDGEPEPTKEEEESEEEDEEVDTPTPDNVTVSKQTTKSYWEQCSTNSSSSHLLLSSYPWRRRRGRGNEPSGWNLFH